MLSKNQIANYQVFLGFVSVVIGVLLLVPVNPAYDMFEALALEGFGFAEPVPTEVLNLVRWLLATVGAGVIGWAIMWIGIAHFALRQGSRWAYYSVVISLIAWALLDIGAAFFYGVTVEILFVGAMLISALTPLFLSSSLYSENS